MTRVEAKGEEEDDNAYVDTLHLYLCHLVTTSMTQALPSTTRVIHKVMVMINLVGTPEHASSRWSIAQLPLSTTTSYLGDA